MLAEISIDHHSSTLSLLETVKAESEIFFSNSAYPGKVQSRNAFEWRSKQNTDIIGREPNVTINEI
jgi:hypothetical protein